MNRTVNPKMENKHPTINQKPEGKGGREQPKKGNQRQKARTSKPKRRKIKPG